MEKISACSTPMVSANSATPSTTIKASNPKKAYKKTLTDIERLMEEVHSYNEKVSAEKST